MVEVSKSKPLFLDSQWCIIKTFREGGVVTPSKPPPPYEQLLPLPPVLRCFWKNPLMTPHHPTSSSFHCYPPPHPPPPPLKILIIHMTAQPLKTARSHQSKLGHGNWPVKFRSVIFGLLPHVNEVHNFAE